jgi:hypothetical protein
MYCPPEARDSIPVHCETREAAKRWCAELGNGGGSAEVAYVLRMLCLNSWSEADSTLWLHTLDLDQCRPRYEGKWRWREPGRPGFY